MPPSSSSSKIMIHWISFCPRTRLHHVSATCQRHNSAPYVSFTEGLPLPWPLGLTTNLLQDVTKSSLPPLGSTGGLCVTLKRSQDTAIPREQDPQKSHHHPSSLPLTMELHGGSKFLGGAYEKHPTRSQLPTNLLGSDGSLPALCHVMRINVCRW